MKIFRLPQLADAAPDGQFVLGPEVLGSETVSLLYGRLRPNEKGRSIRPEPGHEAVVCVIHGRLDVTRGRDAFGMSAGEAFLFVDDEPMMIDNPDDIEAIYIAACAPCGSSAQVAPDVPKPEARCAPEAHVPNAPEITAPRTQPQPEDEVDDEQEFEISLDDEEEPTEEAKDEPPAPDEPENELA